MNRLLHPPFEDQLQAIIGYYHTGSGKDTCRNCHLRRPVLARLLREMHRLYEDLACHTEDGTRPFTLKELISLIGNILVDILPKRRLCCIIQAYDDFQGDPNRICDKYKIARSTYFYYLNHYVKRPYLAFCGERKRTG